MALGARGGGFGFYRLRDTHVQYGFPHREDVNTHANFKVPEAHRSVQRTRIQPRRAEGVGGHCGDQVAMPAQQADRFAGGYTEEFDAIARAAKDDLGVERKLSSEASDTTACIGRGVVVCITVGGRGGDGRDDGGGRVTFRTFRRNCE